MEGGGEMHVHTLPGRNTEVALRPHLYALVGGASRFFYEDEYDAMGANTVE